MHPDILPLHMELERDHWWFVARRRIVRDLLTSVQAPGTDVRLLDLGCGTGGNMEELRSLYECHGVELDPAAVEFAAERYPDCSFVCGSIYEQATWQLDDPVDLCLILDVLEHLDDPRRAVANAADVLRPGGHLLVTVPADPRLWGRHDEDHDHRRRYTTESLAELFNGHPLERRLMSPFNARLYYPIRLFRNLQERVGLLKRPSTTGDLRMPPGPANALLTGLFAGESRRLRAALGSEASPYRNGVSLLAVYRRTGDAK